MIRLDVGTKGAWQNISKKASIGKQEHEATDGDDMNFRGNMV